MPTKRRINVANPKSSTFWVQYINLVGILIYIFLRLRTET